jgi:hypothetical protein
MATEDSVTTGREGADEPLSAARVRDELERRGEAIHGLITVKRSPSPGYCGCLGLILSAGRARGPHRRNRTEKGGREKGVHPGASGSAASCPVRRGGSRARTCRASSPSRACSGGRMR